MSHFYLYISGLNAAFRNNLGFLPWFLGPSIIWPLPMTVIIMAYLIFVSSCSYQQNFLIFWGVSISPGDKTRLIQANYDKSLLSQPTSLLDGWVGGVYELLQANNSRLNFFREGFFFFFFLPHFLLKVDWGHSPFPILSAMTVDPVSGTTTAILWSWGKDLQNHRRCQFFIYWFLNQSLLAITQTLSFFPPLGQAYTLVLPMHAVLFSHIFTWLARLHLSLSSLHLWGLLWLPNLK